MSPSLRRIEDFLTPGYRDRGRWWLMLLPVVILFLWLVYLYANERIFDIPVIIKPAGGETTGTDIYLYWNPVRGKDVKYQVQLDEVGPDFNNLVYEWDGYEKVKIKKRHGLRSGRTYYWRLRSILGGKYRPWSRPVAFRTKGEVEEWEKFGLEITDLEIRDDIVAVGGKADFPDGTLIYIQLNDSRKNHTLYRIAYRVKNGVFEKNLEPDPERFVPGQYVVKVNTYPVQEYPVSEIIGERGTKLATASESGDIVTGLINNALLEARLGSASTRMKRKTFSAVYLDLSVAPGGEETIVLSGRTNLPGGTKLSGIAIDLSNGEMRRNNYIYVKDGRFRGEVKARPGAVFDFDQSDYLAYIVLDPTVQQGKAADRWGPEGENLESRVADPDNLVYMLQAEKRLTIE